MNGRVRIRNGNYDGNAAPHNCYRCTGEDKWVSIAVTNEEEWYAFCNAIGSTELLHDERFNNAENRYRNREQLDRLIEQWTSSHSHYEVTEILQKAGVASMPCFSAEELYKNPHLKERNLYVEIEHPETGREVILGPPWQLSETPAKINTAAPLLGQHNQYVFGEILGMSDDEIKLMMKEEVIY
jgi:benzylsuccinate CoA-transferase BbsF subunit